MERAVRICLYAGAVPLFIIMAVTVIDVFARYILHTSWFDAIELSSIAQVGVIWLAMAFITLGREHVCVGLFTSRMPQGFKRVTDALGFIVGAGMFYLIGKQAWIQSVESMKAGEFLGAMELPRYPSKFVLALGCFLTALSFTLLFLEILIGNRDKPKKGPE
jgi:TRAP-type transport system small permease protein